MIWNFDKKPVVLNHEIPQTLVSQLVWLVGHDRQGSVAPPCALTIDIPVWGNLPTQRMMQSKPSAGMAERPETAQKAQ